MTVSRKLLHLRAGDGGAAGSIDAWSQAHDLQATVCADAYDACVRLLKAADDVPDLVFIGTDWLAPDELEIIRYTRDTWPAATIVLYGGGAGDRFADAARHTHLCRTRAELDELLSHSPEQFFEDAADHGPLESGSGNPRPATNDAPPSATQPPADSSGAPPRPDASDHPTTAREVLTREELAALLGHDDR